MQQKTKVFVTDGSPISVSRILNLMAFSSNVEVIGYAHDPADTLIGLRKHNPDVLVLDIELRGMSGLQLLQSIRKEFPRLTIVILTNASHEQYRRRCFDAGANHFFDKTSEFWKVNDVLSPFPAPYQA